MPYAAPFVRIKALGHFGSSATVKSELWSAGLNVASNSALAPGGSTLLSFLTAISTAYSSFHSNVTNSVGNKCWLDQLSAALIATNGRYAGGSSQATTLYTYPSPVAGAGTPGGPWSQAMAWSLRSAVLRGPGSHGRCFYPATAMTPDPNTGALTGAVQASYGTQVVTLINAINAAATTGLASATNVSNVSPIGLGVQAAVTKIGIGARLDTQESRENKVSEAYAFSNTTIAAAVLEEAERDYVDLLKSLPDFKDR